jgi:hypothetical protein
MKTNLTSILAFLLIFFGSCKKKEENSGATFQLSNVSDQVVINNQSLEWIIPIEHKSGPQEKVTVSIKGLPKNVTLLLDSTTGLLPFNAVFKMSAKFAKPGINTISVIAKSESNVTKQYDVNFTVSPSLVCAENLIGEYINTVSIRNDTTFPERNYYKAKVTYHSKKKVTIECDCKVYYKVVADVFCDDGTLNMPLQFMSSTIGNSIVGTGTISQSGTITLKYAFYDADKKVTRNYIDILN